jgi:4-hydroxy-tetrahydrodipicolinate reductase
MYKLEKNQKYKVIQWGLGPVGSIAVRMMLRRMSLEIVGAIVTQREKIGRDLGELVGREKVGIIASDKLVGNLQADVVLHMTSSSLMKQGNYKRNFEEISVALKAQKNVITTTGFVYPWRNSPEMSEQLDQLAVENGVTLLGTAAAPGFHTDFLPLTLSGSLARVDRIIIREWEDDTIASGFWAKEFMGFGMTLDEFEKQGADRLKNALVTFYLESMYFITDALGWEISEVKSNLETYTATESLQTAVKKIKPGTICAHKVLVEGIKGRNSVIYIEHVFKVCPDRVKEPEGVNLIEIEGRPKAGIKLTHNWWTDIGVITAAHAVNAIPQVVEAPSGFLSLRDLPLVTAIK